jgi:hypothetical protein
VTALATGTYTFTSDSSVDTYGCLYNDSIDPSNPTENLIKCDDDAAGNTISNQRHTAIRTHIRFDGNNIFSL